MNFQSQYRKAKSITLFASCLALGVTSIAAAQSTAVDRHGFFANVGIGYGSEAAVTGGLCSACPAPMTAAPSGHLAAGWTPASDVRIGAEVDMWKGDANGYTTTQFFATVATSYYPAPTLGLWLKLNAGIGEVQSHRNGSGAVTSVAADVYYNPYNGSALALGGGLGYDLPVGSGGFTVIPYANYLVQLSSVNRDPALFQVGVALGYQR